jgi:hypothetical protein
MLAVSEHILQGNAQAAFSCARRPFAPLRRSPVSCAGGFTLAHFATRYIQPEPAWGSQRPDLCHPAPPALCAAGSLLPFLYSVACRAI